MFGYVGEGWRRVPHGTPDSSPELTGRAPSAVCRACAMRAFSLDVTESVFVCAVQA
jgi:hypothetical protein